MTHAKPRENLFLADTLSGLRDRIPLYRWYCAGILERHYPAQGAQALLPLLDDGEAPVRAAAARALGAAGSAQALPRLEPLLLDPYPPARLAALEALCALKHSNRRELAEKLLSDASVAVRSSVSPS